MTRREPRGGQSSRPDRPGEERSLEALLEGSPLPGGDLTRWQPVSQVLTALTSVPESSELSGEARALAEFRARPLHGAAPARPGHRGRVTWLRRAAWPHGPRPAVTLATGAVLIGGLLAVAYAGDLPSAAQRLAHSTIDAPPAGRDAPAGPDPAGSSRLGIPGGQAGSPSGHGPARPDHRAPHGSASGSPRHHRPSSSPSGPAGSRPSAHRKPGHSPVPGSFRPSSSGPGSSAPGSPGPGSPDPSGSPTGSPTPAPTQQPSPSASLAPSPGAAPSPSAAGSASGQSRHHRHPDPAGSSSSPP